jgi:hypothetical protein
MQQLATELLAAMPSRTADGQRILAAVARLEGELDTADRFALDLGYPSRHVLARALMRAGLPPLQQVANWALLLAWLLRCERGKTTLCWIAVTTGRDPAVCYRLVKRLTGHVWSEVVSLGTTWVSSIIRKQYGYPPLVTPLPGARRRSADFERPLVATFASSPHPAASSGDLCPGNRAG